MTKRAYARYFLAIQYIVQTGGTSAFQAFIRDLLSNKSAAETTLDVFNQDWPTFEENVEDYSAKAFGQFVIEDEEAHNGAMAKPSRQH